MTAVQQLGEDVAETAAVPLWPLSDDELTGWLRAARRIEQAAVVLEARLVRHAVLRGVPSSQGYRSTGGWLRSMLLLDTGQATELADGAAKMGRWPQVEQAVLAGRMDWRQAQVIAAAVDAIPAELAELAELDPTIEAETAVRQAIEAETVAIRAIDGETGASNAEDAETGASQADEVEAVAGRPGPAPANEGPTGVDQADTQTAAGGLPGSDQAGDGDGAEGSADAGGLATRAEQVLIGMAGRLTAIQLKKIGQRILSYVAPHLAERAEQAWLARQETRAHDRRTLTLSAPVDGMVRMSGVLGAEDAAAVRAVLHPLCTPTPGDVRTPGQRRADALIEVCRLALRTGQLPEQGGQPAQLSVTVAYHPLTQALGVATTETGERLSAEAVRRLACDARILPHVLGGAGQVLDVGRARRLATASLRRALAVRDGGCAWPDCDRPPGWSDAHHLIGWASGGPTNLENLTLLCRTHHRLIHDHNAGWRVQLGPDGIPEFIPPPHLDSQQRPRRNLYHRRE